MERLKPPITCQFCGQPLSHGNGFKVTGRYGKWQDITLYFCDAQCMIKWDVGDSQKGISGTQAFNLAEDLYNLKDI